METTIFLAVFIYFVYTSDNVFPTLPTSASAPTNFNRFNEENDLSSEYDRNDRVLIWLLRARTQNDEFHTPPRMQNANKFSRYENCPGTIRPRITNTIGTCPLRRRVYFEQSVWRDSETLSVENRSFGDRVCSSNIREIRTPGPKHEKNTHERQAENCRLKRIN